MNNLSKILIAVLIFSCQVAHAIEKPSHRYETTEAPVELESIAQALPSFMAIQEKNYFLDMIDLPALLENVLDQLEGSALTRGGKTILRNTLAPQLSTAFLDKLAAEYIDGSEWFYIRHREFKNSHFLLYRIDYEEGFEYLEMKMARNDEVWKIQDFYTYGTDTWASEAMSSAMSLVGDSFQGSSPTMNTILVQFISAANEMPARAVSLFEKLSEKHQHSEIIQSVYIKSAVSLDEEEYLNVIAKVIELSKPDDFVLAKMGYYRLSKNHNMAIKYLDKLNKKVAGDLEIDLLKAESYLLLGNNKRYAKTLSNAIQEYPESDSTYYTALMLFAQQGRYHEATLVLEILRDEFDTVFDAEVLGSFTELKDFVNSDIFAKWLPSNY